MLINKIKENTFTMQEVLDYFQMSAQAFSDHSEIPKKTIEGWKDKGISSLGRIALKNICMVKVLETEFKLRDKELLKKCDDFNTILDILHKYSKKD